MRSLGSTALAALAALALAVAGCVAIQPASTLPTPTATETSSAVPSVVEPVVSASPSHRLTAAPDSVASHLTMTPSPTAALTVGSTTAPVTGEVAISRFLNDFAYYPPTYHVRSEWYADYLRGDEYQEFDTFFGEGDVSAGDFSGRYALAGMETEVIYVDGVGYIRTPPADWSRPQGFELAIDVNPFFWMTAADIRYEGAVTRVGRRLHHLRADWFVDTDWMTDADWLGEDLAWTEMEDIALQTSDFQIFIRDDGMPTESRLEYVLVGTSDDQDARLSFLYTQIFTRHGEEMVIDAPVLVDPV